MKIFVILGAVLVVLMLVLLSSGHGPGRHGRAGGRWRVPTLSGGEAGIARGLLVAHIAASMGWFGAIAASLALAVVALVTTDPAVIGAVHRVLEPLGWAALIPFSLAALATGVVQSLVSPWGLIRHYWVLTKLVLNAFGVMVLLLYMQTLAELARAAAAVDTVRPSLSPVLHAAAAIVLLLIALVLSVYKPRGITVWGHRQRQRAEPAGRAAESRRRRSTSSVTPARLPARQVHHVCSR